MWIRRITAAASGALGVVGIASLPADVAWWRDMIESIGAENLKWALAALPFLIGLWLWRYDIPWLARLTKEGKQAHRIAELEQPQTITINLAPGATYNEFKTQGGDMHLVFEGKGEIISPSPVLLKTALRSKGIGSASLMRPPAASDDERPQ